MCSMAVLVKSRVFKKPLLFAALKLKKTHSNEFQGP